VHYNDDDDNNDNNIVNDDDNNNNNIILLMMMMMIMMMMIPLIACSRARVWFILTGWAIYTIGICGSGWLVLTFQ